MAQLRPQFGMPAERRAQFQVPNIPRSRISEHAPFRINEHAQCRVFERTSLQRAYVIPCRKWGHPRCYGHAAAHCCLQWARDGGVASILALWRWGRTSKCISSVSFVWIESNFLQCIGDTNAKNGGPEFWNSDSVIFENFWNFQKGIARSLCGRCGPLWSRPN